MRLFVFLILASLATSAIAETAPEKPAPEILDKQATVPFRTDSGLITTEYYLATGKYAQALDVAEAVLKRHPKNADAYVYRGYAFEKIGDVEKARENYQRALKIDPAHLGANRYLAGLYLQAGDLSLAREQMLAMRMICGAAHCEELDEIENDINRYKKGEKR